MAIVVDVYLVGAEPGVEIKDLERQLERIVGELPQRIWRSLQAGPVLLKSKLQRHEADKVAAEIKAAGGHVQLQMVPLTPATGARRKRTTTDVVAHVEVAQQLVARLNKLSERLTGYAGRSLPPAELEAVREALTAASERVDEFPERDKRYKKLRGDFLDLCYSLAAYLPAAERPKFSKAQLNKRAGGRGNKRLVFFLVVVLLLVGARIALFLGVGVSDHDPRLKPPPKHSVKGTGPGAAGAVAPGSKAMNKALDEGKPVVTHVRLILERDGSLKARAVALDPKGKGSPKLIYKWICDAKTVTEEYTGTLISSDVKPGSTYIVEVTATGSGNRVSAPLRTAPLQVPMGK